LTVPTPAQMCRRHILTVPIGAKLTGNILAKKIDKILFDQNEQ
jgi:hypothetical protein